LEYRVDPLTVVARGAAIFAGSQRIDQPAAPQARDRAPGVFSLQLEFKPIGPDVEFLMGGKVTGAPGQRLEGYAVEFVRVGKAEWRSGRIPLSAEGVFMTTLQAEKGVQNRYEVHLLDPQGARQPTVPDSAAYTVGAAFSGAPLTHSIGVAQANNETDFVIRKGTALPARVRRAHRQATAVRRSEAASGIRIPLVEGESPIADGNVLVGFIEVRASQIKRDMPAGTEVELTLSIDESRILSASAYIPLLDEDFEFTKDLNKHVATPESLRDEAQAQTRRLDTVREQAADAQAEGIRQELQRLEEEGIEAQIEEDVNAAAGDQNARQRLQERLAALRDFLNRAERSLAPGRLRTELENDLKWAEDIVSKYGTPEQKRRFQILRGEVQRAIEAGDPLVLRRKDEEVMDLARPILHQQPEFWVSYLRYLTDQRDNMTDPNLADRYIAQGLRAVNTGDVEHLKVACRQLVALLPPEKQEEARGYGGTTIKD
jgi:molecular chaperone DnaK